MEHTPAFNTNLGNWSPLVASLAAGIEDRRLLLALHLCQDQITEPPLGLSQIREAMGCLRPKGKPCDRTIQRWVNEKGMPWALDPASNQRIYFLSKCLAWYQRTFHCTVGSEDAEICARDSILHDLRRNARRGSRKAS